MHHLTSFYKLHPNIGICKPHRRYYMMTRKDRKTSEKKGLEIFLYQITFPSIMSSLQSSAMSNAHFVFCESI